MKHNSRKRTIAFAVAMMVTMGMSMSVWADDQQVDDYSVNNGTQGTQTITQESHQKKYGRDVVYGAWANQGDNFTFENLKFADGSKEKNTDGKPLGTEIAADTGGTITIHGGSIDIPNGWLSTEGGTIHINNATVKSSGAWVNSGEINFNGSTLTGGTLHVGDSSNTTQTDNAITLEDTTASVDNIEIANTDNIKNTLYIKGDSQVTANSTTIDGKNSLVVENTNAANQIQFNAGDLTIKNGSDIQLLGSVNLTVNNLNVVGSDSEFTVSKGSQSTINGEAHIDGQLNVEDKGQTSADTGSIIFNGKTYLNGTVDLQGAIDVTFNDEAHINTPITVQDKAHITFSDTSSAYTQAVETNVMTLAAQPMVNVQTIVKADSADSVTIDKGAKLFISDAKADKTTKYSLKNAIVVGDADNNQYNGSLWQQVYGDNISIEGTVADDGSVVFKKNEDAVKQYAQYSMIPNLIQYASTQDKTTAAGAFFNTAFGAATNGDAKKGAAAFDSAAMMASLGGVAYGTYGFVQDLDTMITNHDREQHGIWASYLRQDKTVDGFTAGNTKANYDLKYNGVIIGGDFHTTDTSRTGAAFAYAKGDITSYGNNAYTKNDNKYYGIGLYHDITAGDMTYRADLGYVRSDNDLTQYNLGKKLTGSPDGSAWYASVRAEKDIASGHSLWTPYIGLRYMQVKTDTFTDSLGISHDMDNANLWNIPIGVSFRHTTQSGAWKYTPVVEVGYVFAAGDKEINETVRLGTASNAFSSELAENHFVGRVGFEAANTAMTLGAHYQYQKGSSTKDNTWDVQVGFRF